MEEQGNHLNYEDWRKDIIERFQDSFDLAALRKKLHTLKQKPEENCRAFVSRLNLDHLLSKVRKMRNDVKTKVLLQGLLPKIKAELYLRMPADFNDFEELCKQLFISEKILQNTKSNEDKELTAVIAGISHHEKQQDKELTQQKLEIETLKQKLVELEEKRDSLLATFRMCHACFKMGHIAKECWTDMDCANQPYNNNNKYKKKRRNQ